MKKRLISLLCLALLTGCGAENTGDTAWMVSQPEQHGLLPRSAEVDVDGAFTLSTEWEEYDLSADHIWFLVENRGETDTETGTEYALEKRLETDGGAAGWYQVPLAEDAGWEAVALALPAGETAALLCRLAMFDYDFSGGGTFRIVKEIGGQTCAGEFRLVEGGAISATAPYGFQPLEDLPEPWGAAEAGRDSVVFSQDGAAGLALAGSFLNKVRLGVPCQLRTVQDYGEGAAMATDVIFEDGCFLWRMKSMGTVEELRFSYLVTDGRDLYLSNGADWAAGERYNDRRTLLAPEGTAGLEEGIDLVERMTADRLAGNAARYRVWNQGGTASAGLTEDPLEFFTESAAGGSVETLAGRGVSAVTAVEWQADGTLRLTCETDAGGRTALCYDPAAKTLSGPTLRGLPAQTD